MNHSTLFTGHNMQDFTFVYRTDNGSFGAIQPNTGTYSPPIEPSGRGLGEMVANKNKPVVLEIGCDSGETTQFLLESNPELTIHCVDPYTDFEDWNGSHVTNRESMYQSVLQRFAPYGERFNQYRQISNDALVNFEDDQFDLIFIDGLHTYEQVLWDCENYYSKVKKGGVFAGHDFDAIPAVKQAVEEFAAKMNKVIMATNHDVWYWIK